MNLKVNHYIDELAKTQSQLDKLSEVVRRSDQEKKAHERRVSELEANLNNVREKLSGIKRSKDDERIINAQLLNDARKREGRSLLIAFFFKKIDLFVLESVKLNHHETSSYRMEPAESYSSEHK